MDEEHGRSGRLCKAKVSEWHYQQGHSRFFWCSVIFCGNWRFQLALRRMPQRQQDSKEVQEQWFLHLQSDQRPTQFAWDPRNKQHIFQSFTNDIVMSKDLSNMDDKTQEYFLAKQKLAMKQLKFDWRQIDPYFCSYRKVCSHFILSFFFYSSFIWLSHFLFR